MIPRLEEIQQPVLNVVYFLWIIAPIVTVITLLRAGFEYMTSQGDPQKVEVVKERMKNVGLSLLFIFGSWIMVTAVINFLGIKDPKLCFEGGEAKVTFQFVFPTPCDTNKFPKSDGGSYDSGSGPTQ